MFYKKCEAHQALLRTGCCGPRVVIGGGIWVVPYFHRLDSIDLAVKNISVEMKAERAVQTCDGIRSCLKAVFYVRVNDTVQDIQAVAQCLGHKTVADADTLADLFSPKFSDILYADDTLILGTYTRNINKVMAGIQKESAYYNLIHFRVTGAKPSTITFA